MASIKISNLCPAGSELFKDSESFMTELVDSELGSINGGTGILCNGGTEILCNSPWCMPGMYSPRCKPSLPRPMPTPPPPEI